MLSVIHKKFKNVIRLLGVLFLVFFAQPVWAAGPPAPSIFSSTLAVSLITLMIVLLIVIAILANLLLGAADINFKKRKKGISDQPILTAVLVLGFLFIAPSLFAQDTSTNEVQPIAKTIGDMPASTFYIMATIIFLELLVIIVLLVNIKFLLASEKKKLITETAEILTIKRPGISWWDRFNKLRPVSQEAELDLGHDYDGIRELNNRLPPWWLYGFYLTIIIAGVYLWRYHVSHTAPLSAQEYEQSVQIADMHVKEYLKKKGENIDETSVTVLTAAEDIQAGKAIFTNPANCVPCHRADAGGVVGPNLTDDYWIYGGNIKDVFKTIKYGTNKGMRSWKDDLSAKQIAQVASYIKSIHGTNPPNPKEHQGDLYKDDLTIKTAADSLKIINDSLKAKDNKVVRN